MKVLVGLFFLVGIASAAEWSYTGDKGVLAWSERDNSNCGGSRQSPIDIPWDLEYYDFEPFSMNGYDNMQADSLRIINNGHTAQINIHPDYYASTTLSGGGLNGTYRAVQLHFHWGEDDNAGSEHTFRSQKFPLEMHIVHYKSEYGELLDALQYGDGLAVLGFFFSTEDADTNSNLDTLIGALADTKYKGSNNSITLNFDDLMPDHYENFYRYEGSLTTPECNEIVIWTVFDKVNTISASQMEQFRLLLKTEPTEPMKEIGWNYRPPQSLNARPVYKNFLEDVAPSWHWGYVGTEGPSYWPNYHQTCMGNRQSPINIPVITDAAHADYDPELGLDTLEFRNYEQSASGIIKNNGHTIQVDINTPEIYIEKGGLDDKYVAAQFHFHWGADNMHGSEHEFEGSQFPLELHIVHYKKSYESLDAAVKQPDGLAVVGFFFEVSPDYNTKYSDLITALSDVKYKDSQKAISGINLRDLTHSNLKINNETGSPLPYYRYQGGLTTPPCLEIVTWSVVRMPIPIHTDQLAAFRQVTHIKSGNPGSHDYITLNYRPVQNIANRKILSSYDFKGLTAAASGVLPNIIAMSVIFVLAVFL